MSELVIVGWQIQIHCPPHRRARKRYTLSSIYTCIYYVVRRRVKSFSIVAIQAACDSSMLCAFSEYWKRGLNVQVHGQIQVNTTVTLSPTPSHTPILESQMHYLQILYKLKFILVQYKRKKNHTNVETLSVGTCKEECSFKLLTLLNHVSFRVPCDSPMTNRITDLLRVASLLCTLLSLSIMYVHVVTHTLAVFVPLNMKALKCKPLV